MLSETLDHCRESAELDPASAYKALKEYVLSSSPSKTLYLLEVRACVVYHRAFVVCSDCDGWGGNTYILIDRC